MADGDIDYLSNNNIDCTIEINGEKQRASLFVSPVGSPGSGLFQEVEIQDQISDPLEFYLSRKITTTNLTSNIAVVDQGDYLEVTETATVQVDDATGAAPDPVGSMWLEIWEGPFKYQGEIISVTGNNLSLAKPIGFPFTTSAVVYIVDVNQNRDFTGTGIGSQYYTYDPPSSYTEDTHETRFMITMLHSNDADPSLYGDIAELPLGIVYSGRGTLFSTETGLPKDLVVYNNLFNIKINEDYKSVAYDVSFDPKSGNPSSPNLAGTSVRKTFNGRDKSGVVIPVRQSRDEATRALFRDDLSTLDLHRIRIIGHQVI